MVSSRKYFPSQRDSEEVFLLLRKHWTVYIPFFIIAGFMSLPLIMIATYWIYNPDGISYMVGNLILIFGSAYALFILSLLLFGFVDYYLDVDIVTSQRIVDIEQNGFFKRKISELSLDQVEDVSATVNGALATFFHYGDVHIQTAGALPNFVFDEVAHPYRISKIILDLHDAYSKGHTISKETVFKELDHVPGSVVNDEPYRRRLPLFTPNQDKILDGISSDLEQSVASGYTKPSPSSDSKNKDSL